MRTLNSNKRILYYRKPATETMEVDDDGNYTGEKVKTFNDWASIRANYNAGSDSISIISIGIQESYDRVVAFGKDECPLTEDTEVYIGNSEPTTDTPANYMVSAINDSINGTLVGLRKVEKT